VWAVPTPANKHETVRHPLTEIGKALMVRHDATAALGSYRDALQVSERFLGRDAVAF